MIEENDLKKAICQSLSIEGLITGWHRLKDETRDEVGGFWVHSIWLATIKGYYYGNVTISVTKYSPERKLVWEEKEVPTLYKGIVLIDNYTDAFVGADPLRSVELPNFTDAVAESLQQINLMPQILGIAPDGEGKDFELKVFVPNFFTHLRFNGLIQDAGIKKVWENINETLEVISKAYNDKDMNDFFDLGISHTFA